MEANNLWRIHIRPYNVSPDLAVAHCLAKSVVGFGWQLPKVPANKEDAWKMAEQEFKNNSWRKAYAALLYKCQIDDLIWMRDCAGVYHLGRITNDWKYDSSAEARSVDIANIRKCEWKQVGTQVPGKILNCFRPSATMQRIDNKTALWYSMLKWNELVGNAFYDVRIGQQDIFSLLDAYDLEDLVSLYIQKEYGYLLIPSTRALGDTTIRFEYEFIHESTGRHAIMQVKSGGVWINRDCFMPYVEMGKLVFLFTAHGKYTGAEHDSIQCILPQTLETFLARNKGIMPDSITTWLKYLEANSVTVNEGK